MSDPEHDARFTETLSRMAAESRKGRPPAPQRTTQTNDTKLLAEILGLFVVQSITLGAALMGVVALCGGHIGLFPAIIVCAIVTLVIGQFRS